jgi:transketolase
LHAIGNQAREAIRREPYKPMILVCAHAGLKTGEDGPTHADPQALQVLQENFPKGTAISLTPWDPQEIWTLMAETFVKRPAVISCFVTRPNEKVPDRSARGLTPAAACATGVYQLRKAKGKSGGTIVLQESGVTYSFVEEALPRLEKEGIDLDVHYVASAELFDLLSEEERNRIYPESAARDAMGITGFTLSTMYRWVSSEFGRSMTLHPFRKGHYLGSGQAAAVLAEAGLDGESQYRAIKAYVEKRRNAKVY